MSKARKRVQAETRPEAPADLNPNETLLKNAQALTKQCRAYCPIDEDGRPRARGNEDKFARAVALLNDFAAALPALHAKLAAITTEELQAPQDKPRIVTIDVFSSSGQRVQTVTDGVVVWSAENPQPDALEGKDDRGTDLPKD